MSTSNSTTLGSTSDPDDDDDIYDDIIVMVSQEQKQTTQESDTVVLQKQGLLTQESEAVITPQGGKPNLPHKPLSIQSHPKVEKIRQLKKLKRLEEIEEIYDLEPLETDDVEFEEVYIDSSQIIESDDSDEATKLQGETSEVKAMSTLAHKAGHGQDTTSTQDLWERVGGEEGEAYQELVIYEQLRTDEENGYQDIEKARIEALGLPEQIRHRSARITKGPERRKLRKSIKNRSGDHRSPTGDKARSNTLPPDIGCVNPAPTLGLQGLSDQEKDEEEEKSHDGYMSHEKARQVLDMLLEANNVRKISHLTRSQSVMVEPIPVTVDSDIDEEQALELPPEMREYQQAGVLKVKSPAEIAAEVKLLVESAPAQAPPLPGIQRARTGRVTMSDSLIRRRQMMKKANTMPATMLTDAPRHSSQ